MSPTANKVFAKGKLTFLMDSQPGSSGKAKMSSFIIKNSSKCNFLVTSNSPNASHRVVDNGVDIVFKSLPSGSLYHDKIERIFIVAGAILDLPSLYKECELIGLHPSKVVIHPRCGIASQLDIDYEKGLCDLDGNYGASPHAGTIKTGSTCSGSGAVLAKKVLRHRTLVTAGDAGIVDALRERGFTVAPCEVEIMDRLDRGQSGLFEIGQGFPLSNNHWRFAPHTTSRQVTTAGALSDAFLPPSVAGNLVLNCRAHPIRINSKKYVTGDGKHLTWDEVQSGNYEYTEVESNSGSWYPDQHEISWESIEEGAGITIPQEVKNTTLTKLPRRVATFSTIGLAEAIRFNETGKTYLTVNFANFIDGSLQDARDHSLLVGSDSFCKWIDTHLEPAGAKPLLFLVGTGMETDSTIVCP